MSDSTAKEHRTVSRVTMILEAAAASRGGVSLGTLASALAAPKSSVHGLVKGLVATGYLEEFNKGAYEIGPAVAMLNPSRTPSVQAKAHRALETIQRACDESATLCTLVGNSVVYVDHVESTQMVRYSAPLRVRRPIYPTSAGKCFLAYMPETRRLKYLREQLGGTASVADALAELAEIVEVGYSMNRGETVPDVYAVASPILSGMRVLACLQVAGPKSRMVDRMTEIGAVLVSETQRLSHT